MVRKAQRGGSEGRGDILELFKEAVKPGNSLSQEEQAHVEASEGFGCVILK